MAISRLAESTASRANPALRFPGRVKKVSNDLGGKLVFRPPPPYIQLPGKGLSIRLGLASRLLRVSHYPRALGEELAFRHNGTSVGVDGASRDLAVRVLRGLVAGTASGSISVGSDRRSTHALRPGNECPGNGQQCKVDARCRHASHSAPCEPDVEGCDLANAVASTGRPGRARTV